MSPKGRKLISLFLILLLAINCIPIKAPVKTEKSKISPKQTQTITSSSELETIEPGTRIFVLLRSGIQIRGKYDGLSHVSTEEYAESYAQSREQNKEEIMLPALGERVIVTDKQGIQHKVEFFGFDYGAMLLRKPGDIIPVKTNIRLIKNILDSSGNIIEIETIVRLISAGKIPLLSSGIILQVKKDKTQIAWGDVYLIQLKKKFKKKDIPPLLLTLALAAGSGLLLYLFIKLYEEIYENYERCSYSEATRDSPLYPYLDTLRDFRDKYLIPSKLGRVFVDLYYKYSPFVANLIAKNKMLKIKAQIIVLPLIAFSYSMVHLGPIITALIIAFICMLPILFTPFFRKILRQVR